MRHFIIITALTLTTALTGCASKLPQTLQIKGDKLTSLEDVQTSQELDSELYITKYTNFSATLSGRDYTGIVAPCNLSQNQLEDILSSYDINSIIEEISGQSEMGNCNTPPPIGSAFETIKLTIDDNGDILKTLMPLGTGV